MYKWEWLLSFMAGAASQAEDSDSSRAPGLTSGLQGSMNVHRGALLLVPQWQCISSFVFYIHVMMYWYALKRLKHRPSIDLHVGRSLELW